MIQQKVEPAYNPRRLLRLAMMDVREETFESPTTWLCSACDLCNPTCPQEIHISGVIGAIKQLAVEAGYTSPLETATVDESLYSGCGVCVMACPYKVPHRVDKEVDGQTDRFSEADAIKCMGCATHAMPGETQLWGARSTTTSKNLIRKSAGTRRPR